MDTKNPFTVSFIAEAVLDLERGRPDYEGCEENRGKLDAAADALLQEFEESETGGISIDPYPPSAYLTQLTYRALKRMGKADDELKKKVHQWAAAEVNKQVALLSSKSRSADPLNLAYALILAADEVGISGFSLDERSIFAHALRQFFAEAQDGTWPLSQPLFHYREHGNAYCFEYELLTQLLQCDPLREPLLEFIPQLERAAKRLDTNSFLLRSPIKGRVVAWSSGHHRHLVNPESWSTAAVYQFVFELDRLVAEAIRQATFREFGAIYSTPRRPEEDPKVFAAKLLDAPLDLATQKGSLKQTVVEYFVQPIAKEAKRVENGESLPSDTPMSAILFGPPGTSKTTLAGLIADYLHWPLLQIDPSYLVQKGWDHVQAQASRLFSMLTATERVVVLLDEFDEIGRDRSGNQEILSRFITTAMLPKLARINQERRIVFLLATNYIRSFDAAFSRGGRFDMRIPVFPPTVDEKHRHWSQFAELEGKLESDKAAKARILLAHLTYEECRQLAGGLTPDDSADSYFHKLSEIHEGGTLKRPLTAEVAERTWENACIDDQRQIRLPPIKVETGIQRPASR